MRRAMSLERHGFSTSGPAHVHSLTHASRRSQAHLVGFHLPPACFTGCRCTTSGNVTCILTQRQAWGGVGLHDSQCRLPPAEVPWCVSMISPLDELPARWARGGWLSCCLG